VACLAGESIAVGRAGVAAWRARAAIGVRVIQRINLISWAVETGRILEVRVDQTCGADQLVICNCAGVAQGAGGTGRVGVCVGSGLADWAGGTSAIAEIGARRTG
jgi:hypothetical protein